MHRLRSVCLYSNEFESLSVVFSGIVYELRETDSVVLVLVVVRGWGASPAMADTFEQRTIREHLLGMVANHLSGGTINCGVTHQVGCELVSLLSAYREEERRLF